MTLPTVGEGKRKYTVAILILMLSSILVVLGYVEGGHWVTITLGVMGLYGFSNVGEYVAKRKSSG